MAIRLLSEAIEDEEQRWFHIDCAAMKAAMEKELIIYGMFAAADGSKRQKLIEERFGEMFSDITEATE